jgi:hypothetical protein
VKDSNYTPGRDSSVLDSDEEEEAKKPAKKSKNKPSKQVVEAHAP